MDERFWIPVSSEVHRRIHNYPEWARLAKAVTDDGRNLMLLCDKGQWNTMPKDL